MRVRHWALIRSPWLYPRFQSWGPFPASIDQRDVCMVEVRRARKKGSFPFFPSSPFFLSSVRLSFLILGGATFFCRLTVAPRNCSHIYLSNRSIRRVLHCACSVPVSVLGMFSHPFLLVGLLRPAVLLKKIQPDLEPAAQPAAQRAVQC